MTIETAIRELIDHYDVAKNSVYIEDPVAWALHHVWRYADSDRMKRKREVKGDGHEEDAAGSDGQ